MKREIVLLGLLSCVVGWALQAERLLHDQAAYQYCLQEPQSFVVIIWPIAQGKNEKIQRLLAAYGAIKYQKSRTFSPDQAERLLRLAHPQITDMKKHIAWYFPQWAYQKQARIFVVNYPNLATAVACKYAIRKLFPKLQYRSIHINDTHHETVQFAQLLLQ